MHISVDVYDPHSMEVGKKSYAVQIEDVSAHIYFRSHLDGTRPSHYSFLCDELAMTDFLHFFPKNRRVALLKESPIITGGFSAEELHRNFNLVLTHREDLLRIGPPFHKALFSSSWVATSSPGLKKTKLLSFVGNVERTIGEGYIFRAEVGRYLKGKADLYGKGLKPVSCKDIGMRDYCFSVSMENCRENFYFSEKLIDCFLMGCIPIYWGCPAIGDVFDKRGMLFFESIDELDKVVSRLSFELFEQMRPFALKNMQKAREMRLDSFEGYLARSVSTAIFHLGKFAKPMSRLSVSKLMAGPRFVFHRITR